MATSAEPTLLGPGDLSGPVEVVGRISDSSNLAVLARLVERDGAHVIYKPVHGERPLWDFPEGTLAGREVAAYLVSALGGWDLVPPTVLRDGPLGTGSVQLWVGDPFDPVADDRVVDLVPGRRVPTGWVGVLDGETAAGERVRLVHQRLPDVRSLAVLDAALNNSDRKGSHCLRDDEGRLWAIDHGVCFSPTPKLRTVLWGWAGEPLAEEDRTRLARLARRLARPATRAELGRLLPAGDVEALEARVRRLLARGRLPEPAPGWPTVPWPPL